MKISVLMATLFLLAQCICAQENHLKPEDAGCLVIRDLLSRPDFMMYNTPDCSAVHYAEACAGFGAVRLAAALKDTALLDSLTIRYNRVLDEKIPNTANHVDANVYGILPLQLFLYNHNERFFSQGIDLAVSQWENPLSDGLTNQTRYWIDDIWMISSLQVQAYRATGDTMFLNRAAREINSYITKLQQPSGLFFHGPDAHFYWGRGNGWVAAGLAELLSELPASNLYYKNILDGYKKMMNALIQHQADDGMWRQLIDNPDSYKETSSTAMFGYAMMVGVKRNLLPEEPFRNASLKAWDALSQYISKTGQVSDVCVGTGQSKDVNYYLTRPKVTGDLHGQAPVLWFAWILLSQ